MSKILCKIGLHKLPVWKKNPKESMFVSIPCVRCGKEQIESNFYYPWEKEYEANIEKGE